MVFKKKKNSLDEEHERLVQYQAALDPTSPEYKAVNEQRNLVKKDVNEEMKVREENKTKRLATAGTLTAMGIYAGVESRGVLLRYGQTILRFFKGS